MKKKAISILSGGLDSCTATKLALDDYECIKAITFDYGQRAAKKEIEAARFFCETENLPHQVISLPWFQDIIHTSLVDKTQHIPETSSSEIDLSLKADQERACKVWVPNRNGLFLSIAACFAESLLADALIVGFNAEEAVTFPDNSEKYLNSFTDSLSYSTLNKVKIISPTLHMKKAEVAQAAKSHKINISKLWWCYHGAENPCGKCESCVRNERALAICLSSRGA
ncbi:MAG: 7-cyano-7-deazaguanine synthase QueC [Deltaproteobacteria bacterium CG_4_10_14_0_2_um_filter_43_8]|nr:MAG: 7-cyano-7-deazaguanine synthase QueC [Deltaproteobacteria bacterium CG11_big_fil_rev_8_21_14_0_20_42_23]PJA19217.1 MAG: 7-cyano-7-deazaguanine synthase QueC [Deltaproteobacteria bacterium CG_4_10_14_0_2_um_filter_43_8]PJC64483.1 MAG: 7-cyano-7-deazaguanine synthase QueC [Deltaproteobacteria bacterium CG_4_9_14_0_2_um_filter_42_21]